MSEALTFTCKAVTGCQGSVVVVSDQPGATTECPSCGNPICIWDDGECKWVYWTEYMARNDPPGIDI